MDPVTEKILLLFLGALVGFGLRMLKDRIAASRQRIKEAVERYIQFAEKEPFQNQEAHRLSGMVRAGVPLLKNDKELNAFFEEVTGRGYPHPWWGCSVGDIFSKLKPMVIIRAMASDSRTFASDADIYGWLVYEVTKKTDDQADQGTKEA